MTTIRHSFYSNLIESAFSNIGKPNIINDSLNKLSAISEKLTNKPKDAYLVYTGCYGAYGSVSRAFHKVATSSSKDSISGCVTHFPTDDILIKNSNHYLCGKRVPIFIPLIHMCEYFGFGISAIVDNSHVIINETQKNLLKEVFITADTISRDYHDTIGRDSINGCIIFPSTCESLLPSWPFGELVNIVVEPQYREYHYKDIENGIAYCSSILFLTLNIGKTKYQKDIIITLPIPFFISKRNIDPSICKYEPLKWNGYNSSLKYNESAETYRMLQYSLNSIHDAFKNKYPEAINYEHLADYSTINFANRIDDNNPASFIQHYRNLKKEIKYKQDLVVERISLMRKNNQPVARSSVLPYENIFINMKTLKISLIESVNNDCVILPLSSTPITTANSLVNYNEFSLAPYIDTKNATAFDKSQFMNSVINILSDSKPLALTETEFTKFIFQIYNTLCKISPRNMENYQKTFICASSFFTPSKSSFNPYTIPSYKTPGIKIKCNIEDLIVFMMISWSIYRLSKYIQKTQSKRLSPRIISEFNTIINLLNSPRGLLNRYPEMVYDSKINIIDNLHTNFVFDNIVSMYKDKSKFISAYLEVVEIDDKPYFGKESSSFSGCRSVFNYGYFEKILTYITSKRDDIGILPKYSNNTTDQHPSSLAHLLIYLSGEINGTLHPQRRICHTLNKENKCFEYFDITCIRDKRRFFEDTPYGKTLKCDTIRELAINEVTGVASLFNKVNQSDIGEKVKNVPIDLYDLNNFSISDLQHFIENVSISFKEGVRKGSIIGINIMPDSKAFTFTNLYTEGGNSTLKTKLSTSTNIISVVEVSNGIGSIEDKIKQYMKNSGLDLTDFNNKDISNHPYFTPFNKISFTFDSNHNECDHEINERLWLLVDFIIKIQTTARKEYGISLHFSKAINTLFEVYFAIPMNDRVIGMQSVMINGQDLIGSVFMQNKKSYHEIETMLSVLL